MQGRARMRGGLPAVAAMTAGVLLAGAPGAAASGPPADALIIDTTIPLVCTAHGDQVAASVRLKASTVKQVEQGEAFVLNHATAKVELSAAAVNLAIDKTRADRFTGKSTKLMLGTTNAVPGSLNVTNPPVDFGPISLVRDQVASFVLPPEGSAGGLGPIRAVGTVGDSVELRFTDFNAHLQLTSSTDPSVKASTSLDCQAAPGADTLLVKVPIVASTIPVVTSISPVKGPTTGGTVVTITGKYLGAATAVKFGTKNATKIVKVSDTQIRVTSPAGKGKVEVIVITPRGSSACPVVSAASAASEGTVVASSAPCAAPVFTYHVVTPPPPPPPPPPPYQPPTYQPPNGWCPPFFWKKGYGHPKFHHPAFWGGWH